METCTNNFAKCTNILHVFTVPNCFFQVKIELRLIWRMITRCYATTIIAIRPELIFNRVETPLPEGPEIRLAADKLAKALSGRKTHRLFFAFEHLKPYEKRLCNKRILSVQAKGKAILTHFDNGYSLYSHNQLYGRWQIIEGDDYPQSTRSLRLAIHNEDHTALLYSASDIEVLKTQQLDTHPYLSRLGPDLLDPETTIDTVIERLHNRARRRCLMGLLQDQSTFSGMGNYLCCEVLHVSGIHPQQRPIDLNDEQLQQLAKNCLLLTRQSYQTQGITNEKKRAAILRKQGLAFEDYRFHIYRRANQACYHCKDIIIKGRFCGRMGYICPTCQQN